MIALRGQSTWRVFIIHVYSMAFGDVSVKTWVLGDTPLHFPCMGGGSSGTIKAWKMKMTKSRKTEKSPEWREAMLNVRRWSHVLFALSAEAWEMRWP